MSNIAHLPDNDLEVRIDGDAKKALKSFVDRIEDLEVDKQNVAEDIKDVYAQAKGSGFDTKILRQVIRRRKIERQAREEQDTMIDVYEDTLDSVEGLLE